MIKSDQPETAINGKLHNSVLRLLTLQVFIAFAAGVAVEVIQALVPRLGSYDPKDMIYTGVGALTGAVWALLLG